MMNSKIVITLVAIAATLSMTSQTWAAPKSGHSRSSQGQSDSSAKSKSKRADRSAMRQCLFAVHDEAKALFQQIRASCGKDMSDPAACEQAKAEIEVSLAAIKEKIKACRDQQASIPPAAPNPDQNPRPRPDPGSGSDPKPTPTPRPTPNPMPMPLPDPMPSDPSMPDPSMPAPTEPAPALDGAKLYNMNCAICHGALANSARKGRSAEQIAQALRSVNAMKQRPELMALTPAEISAIAQALGGKP